jgi:hypothetical protein
VVSVYRLLFVAADNNTIAAISICLSQDPQVVVQCFAVNTRFVILFKESEGKFQFNIRQLILSATCKYVTFLLISGKGWLVVGQMFK